MKEFEALLERYWILKAEDPELYQSVKDALPKLKPFFEGKLGYRLVLTPRLIKLEKLPGEPEQWMGIGAFDDRMEYAFLCLLLMFLEDLGPQEQFVLSQVTDFIQSVFPEQDEKVDWTLFKHRKSLVKVLNFAVTYGMIKVDDGDDQEFTTDISAEVLYENTGVSRYMVRYFSRNILNYSDWRDFEDDEWVEIARDKGVVRRNRVYRRIFLSPAVYAREVDDPDFLYIKNQRGMIEKDLRELLSSEFQVHKTSAFLVLDPGIHFQDVFPSQKAISAIVLQVNHAIQRMVAAKDLIVREDDTIRMARTQLERIINQCRREWGAGWSKEFREMPDEKLYHEVFRYMMDYAMLETGNEQQEIQIMPLAGKICGGYLRPLIPAGTSADEEMVLKNPGGKE